VDEPLKSVIHGKCNARSMVNFPAAQHHCPTTATKSYCLNSWKHAVS